MKALLVLRLIFLSVVLLIQGTGLSFADEADIRDLIAGFAEAKKFSQVETIANDLAATGDPSVVTVLRALQDGKLKFSKNDKSVVIHDDAGKRLLDPITGNELGPDAGVKLKKVKTKNSLRRKIGAMLSGLTLRAKDRDVRLKAAKTIFASADKSQLDVLTSAIEEESDDEVKTLMREAQAAILVTHSDDEAARLKAIDTLASRGDQAMLALLNNVSKNSDGAVKDAALASIAKIESSLATWRAGQNIWYGVSLGSVLFLAAIGLAITFGVMGVINMAHGEMVMIGAYTTFVVQDIIRTSAPHLFDYSLVIALPMAFLVAGFVGLLMERCIIRYLYGRPLETLLATWGVSLILQQAVRTIFGPNNREVGNPSFMSGAFELGEMAITWNRLWIVVFAIVVFAILLAVLNRTSLGLKMRAVTQNRRMASAMGIRTPWVDAMTFALGTGIAGIAGVALSQIDNVSPNLGQSYIVDSFMVVVFGGVGNLWGTFIGALTLGVANKFLEPYAGAVLAKIFVLVFIILFIQRRPRGLFALKGRAVEQ
ncbi:MAG: urea ABC transporter permease subunit UrtB [Hyphomicrobiales bacterium]